MWIRRTNEEIENNNKMIEEKEKLKKILGENTKSFISLKAFYKSQSKLLEDKMKKLEDLYNGLLRK